MLVSELAFFGFCFFFILHLFCFWLFLHAGFLCGLGFVGLGLCLKYLCKKGCITNHPTPSYSFFNEALRIGEHGYVPTETDVLRARQKSTGITETRFNMGQLS